MLSLLEIHGSDYFDLILLILRSIREQVLVADIISRGHCYCFERTLREKFVSYASELE